MVNSRRKGKVGELHFAQLLTQAGFPARRGQQFRGGPESPDIVCETLPVHFEVKTDEHLNIHQALAQAQREASQGKMPVVAHKKKRTEWLVTLRAVEWLATQRMLVAAFKVCGNVVPLAGSQRFERGMDERTQQESTSHD